MRYKATGWFGESYRHSLAAKGMTLNRQIVSVPKLKNVEIPQPQMILPSDVRVRETTTKTITGSGYEGAKRSQMPTARKLADVEKAKEIRIRLAAEDEIKRLDRILSGDLSSIPSDTEFAKMDQYTKNKYRDAAFRGALAVSGRGDKNVPYDDLKDIGLSSGQIESIKREYMLATTGSPTFRREKILGGTGKALIAGLEGAEDIGATGLKNLKEEWSAPPSESVLDKLGRERAEQRKVEADGKGVFNPLRIAGLGDIADSEPAYKKKEKLYSRAMDAENEVNSIFNSKDSLASVDLSGYDDGEVAFRTGNREGLIKSITKLETEQMKLKDRWSIVQGVRNIVLSPDNRNQTIHMEQSDDLLPNYLMGSGGGGKLSEQTRKVAAVENKIKNNSNLLATRVGLLRSKLQRMNAAVPPDATVPRRIEVVSPNGGNPSTPGNILNNLDSGKGAFKGLNPWSDEQ